MKIPSCPLITAVASCCILCWLAISAWAVPPVPFNMANDPGARSSSPEIRSASEDVAIPGPLRSFLRMAGISQKVPPEEVLALLGHNVASQGFEVDGRPTEFLILLSRYVQQARELVVLASPNRVIRVSNCEEARPLLRILGYRPRPDCGTPGTFLETADAERAFLTIDSGFPLPDLEETLQGGKPFEYPFAATRVPALSEQREWISASKKNEKQSGRDVLDTLLRDPAVGRLYWAFSRLDPETRSALRRSPGIKKLVAFSTALSFYGSHICVRSGRVLVPGGARSEAAWKDLVGASPDSPGDFVQRLLAKDKGWMAAYFDVLARVNSTQQTHFTEPQRLQSYYEALKAHNASVDATTGSYRPAPGLLLLVTRLRWDSNGEPYVPGNLELWKNILRQKSESKLVRELGKRSGHITTPDQLLQDMFALARENTEFGPLQIYLALSEIESRRSAQQRLRPETMLFLARRFEEFSCQYRVFSEFPELNDASVSLFVEVAESLDAVPNTTVRGNALGMFQANVGLWQILARQGQIPSSRMNDSWQKIVKPFAKIHTSAQIYDSGRASLAELFQAADKGEVSQDELIELIAGPRQSTPEAKKMHEQMANRIRAILDEQRLVSLDTVLTLGETLKQKEKGTPVDDSLVSLAGELREFEMPQPIFTRGERSKWAAGVYNNRHTELQLQTDVARVLKSYASHVQLEGARGQLASFLRDILVGLNYAYYEPPGAQALHNNPLFVRSHDFAAETVSGIKGVWQAPQLFGEGSPAGGGAHLIGSLADLPFVLAELEQDFIAPENVQALIWREFVPGLMTSAVLPRWWGISRNELHAITLYQRSGEELLAASASDKLLRKRVMVVLADRMSPQEAGEIEQALIAGRVSEALLRISPADTFYLAAEFRQKFVGENTSPGAATQELQKLSEQYPDEVSWDRLSRDFGVPHPTLAQTYARELLNIPRLPAFAGYSSRLLAESWDSGNLYWARLADERGYPPETLNRLVPELTRRMVEKIFATNFEDWPALLRALRETGEDFKQGKVAMALPSSSMALVDVVPVVGRRQ